MATATFKSLQFNELCASIVHPSPPQPLSINLCKYPSSISKEFIAPTLRFKHFKQFSALSPVKNDVRMENMETRKQNPATKTLNSKTQGKLGSGVSDLEFTDEKIAKHRRKNKVNSVEFQLRIGLDMCSKKGDVLGAISLYDSALREGVKLNQYHYTVLLYLCSSAAVGIVQPAKSGSKGSFDKVSVDFGGNSDVDCWNFGKTVLNSEFLSGLSKDLGKNGGETRGNFDEIESNSQFASGFSVDLGKNGCGCSQSLHNIDSNSNVVNNDMDHGQSNGTTDSDFEDALFVEMGKQDSDTVDSGNKDDRGIRVSDNIKRYAFSRGLKIYDKMLSEKVPLSEAVLTSVARMAMSMGDGDLAFEMVKKMKELGINPRLRSYGPALFTFCDNKDIKKAFKVEQHMLESGIYPEEPELEALLRLSIGVGSGEKVYSLLHKLRRTVRKISPSTANLIEQWFKSMRASRFGKRKWHQELVRHAMENGGGGWHGLGWLGRGKWSVLHTVINEDGVCKGCGEKLVTIDIDPIETEKFARSVASIAGKRERNSSFQRFQKWLDYYGPFEAVVDAANVGLFSQRRFLLSKVNAVVNGIRQKLPSKKWPLIIGHNKRITGGRADEPANKKLIDKWKNADALYATPTGSNDDWYWLYAAVKCKSLIVTNDEMRDHVFQVLGNDFFPKWKERHQVHFSFRDGSPEFHMPPPCSVVIQICQIAAPRAVLAIEFMRTSQPTLYESENGHWHIPVASEHEPEKERSWLCVTRANPQVRNEELSGKPEGIHHQHESEDDSGSDLDHGNGEAVNSNSKKIYENPTNRVSTSKNSKHRTILSQIEVAEKISGYVLDFQI